MQRVENHTDNGATKEIIHIDEETMEEVFPKYYSRLVDYANEYLNDDEKAQDIVNETFMALWERREEVEFHHEKQLRGYLYTAARNKALNAIQQTEKEEATRRELTHLGKNGQHSEELDTAILMAEAIATIKKAVHDLSPQCRAVMILLLEGKSNEEISIQLRMKPELVRKNKSLGIIALRKRVNRQVLVILLVMIAGLQEVKY